MLPSGALLGGKNPPTGPFSVTELNPTDCTELREVFSLPSRPTTLGYLPPSDEVAVSSTGPTVDFYDRASGVPTRSCTLDIPASDNIYTLAWLEGHAMMAVMYGLDEEWVLADPACNVLETRGLMSGGPRDFTWDPSTATFLAAASSGPALRLVAANGVELGTLELTNTLPKPDSLAPIAGSPGTWHALQDQTELASLHIPGLLRPRDLSGAFTSPSGADVHLFERADGVLTGALVYATSRWPVFGHVDAGLGVITVGTRAPAGSPYLGSGTVPDLDTAILPPPLGTLTRR